MRKGNSMHASFVQRMAAKLGALSAAVLPALSLAQSNADEEEVVEEIVVTGSRIPRRDFTAPSPIFTVDREQLMNSSQPTLEETLNKMPQIQPDFGRASNNPGDGQAHINLRGLGANRTLVMLNGRRLAPSGIGSSVDVNNLPQAMMDRVEIITGGAATVYGSDAVAGVVNFITREDFEGLTRDWSLGVRRYELLPDRVVFYLRPHPGGSRFDFRFTPKFGMTAKTQPSVLYDYYNPDARSVVAPTVIAVR